MSDRRAAPQATRGTGLPDQIAMLLRRKITSGVWSVGQKLPTLSELAAEHEVARVTMQHALTRLADEGLILRRRRHGTFVIAEPVEQRWFTLATDFEGLASEPGSQVSRLVECHPSEHLPSTGTLTGTLVDGYQFLRHVHSRGAVPTSVTEIHLACSLFEQAGAEAFEACEVMTVLAGLHGLALIEARQTLTIGGADKEIAAWLEVPLNAPLAELRRLVLDQEGRVVYIGHLVFRGDLVRLDFTLRNEAARFGGTDGDDGQGGPARP